MDILTQNQQSASPLGENQDYSYTLPLDGTDTTATILNFYRAIGAEKYGQLMIRATKIGDGEKDHTIILSGG